MPYTLNAFWPPDIAVKLVAAASVIPRLTKNFFEGIFTRYLLSVSLDHVIDFLPTVQKTGAQYGRRTTNLDGFRNDWSNPNQDQIIEIAAIITEPIMCNSGCILPEIGFLESLRQITKKNDIALIFDEVITGFRTALGGAQQYYGVTPDLSVFAKAIASGFPISVIAGKRQWMQLVADSRVIHAGTMNSACVLVAAALGTLEVLEESGTYKRIFRLGKRLMKGLERVSQETGQNLLVQGIGPMFHTGFCDLIKVKEFRDLRHYEQPKSKMFIQGLQQRGIRVIGRGLWYISSMHTEDHIDHTILMAKDTLQELKTANL